MDESFHSCMAIVRALSQRNPETVNLANTLTRIGFDHAT